MQVLLGEHIFFYAWLIPPFKRYPLHEIINFPDQYTCGEPGCFEVCGTLGKLRKHTNSTRHQPYQCKCGFQSKTKSEVENHVAYSKREESKNVVHYHAIFRKAHTCAVKSCGRVFSNSSELEKHAKVNSHKAFQCICSKGFSKLCSLTRHIDESCSDAVGKYKCPLKRLEQWRRGWPCTASFKRINHLEQHFRGKIEWDCHELTDEEVEALLSPYRKRKPAASKSALTARVDTKVNDVHDYGPPATTTGNPTESICTISDKVSAHNAFIPSTQDTQTIKPTAELVFGQAGLGVSTTGFIAGAPAVGGFPSTASVSLFDPLARSNSSLDALPAPALSSFSSNMHSWSQSACDGSSFPFVDRHSGGYATPAVSGPAMDLMDIPTAWTCASGQAQFQGFGVQNSASFVVPGSESFIDQNSASYADPSAYPASLQPSAFSHAQMDFFSTPAGPMMTMMAPPGQSGMFAGHFEASTFTPIGFDTGAYTQPPNGLMDPSLDISSMETAQPQAFSHVAEDGPSNNFNLPEDMDLCDAGMDFDSAGMGFGGAGF